MSRNEFWLFLSLVAVVFWTDCCSAGSRFFRISCLDGTAPENLAIASDEFGQIFLEFDTQDQRTRLIEATDSLSPSPAWTGISAIVSDAHRATWLVTWRWSRTLGGTSDGYAYAVQQTSNGGYISAGRT